MRLRPLLLVAVAAAFLAPPAAALAFPREVVAIHGVCSLRTTTPPCLLSRLSNFSLLSAAELALHRRHPHDLSRFASAARPLSFGALFHATLRAVELSIFHYTTLATATSLPSASAPTQEWGLSFAVDARHALPDGATVSVDSFNVSPHREVADEPLPPPVLAIRRRWGSTHMFRVSLDSFGSLHQGEVVFVNIFLVPKQDSTDPPYAHLPHQHLLLFLCSGDTVSVLKLSSCAKVTSPHHTGWSCVLPTTTTTTTHSSLYIANTWSRREGHLLGAHGCEVWVSFAFFMVALVHLAPLLLAACVAEARRSLRSAYHPCWMAISGCAFSLSLGLNLLAGLHSYESMARLSTLFINWFWLLGVAALSMLNAGIVSGCFAGSRGDSKRGRTHWLAEGLFASLLVAITAILVLVSAALSAHHAALDHRRSYVASTDDIKTLLVPAASLMVLLYLLTFLAVLAALCRLWAHHSLHYHFSTRRVTRFNIAAHLRSSLASLFTLSQFYLTLLFYVASSHTTFLFEARLFLLISLLADLLSAITALLGVHSKTALATLALLRNGFSIATHQHAPTLGPPLSLTPSPPPKPDSRHRYADRYLGLSRAPPEGLLSESASHYDDSRAAVAWCDCRVCRAAVREAFFRDRARLDLRNILCCCDSYIDRPPVFKLSTIASPPHIPSPPPLPSSSSHVQPFFLLTSSSPPPSPQPPSFSHAVKDLFLPTPWKATAISIQHQRLPPHSSLNQHTTTTATTTSTPTTSSTTSSTTSADTSGDTAYLCPLRGHRRCHLADSWSSCFPSPPHTLPPIHSSPLVSSDTGIPPFQPEHEVVSSQPTPDTPLNRRFSTPSGASGDRSRHGKRPTKVYRRTPFRLVNVHRFLHDYSANRKALDVTAADVRNISSS